MLAARALLVGLSIVRPLSGADAAARRFAPSYASSTVVNAASQESGFFRSEHDHYFVRQGPCLRHARDWRGGLTRWSAAYGAFGYRCARLY
jgi:hypothetical protein